MSPLRFLTPPLDVPKPGGGAERVRQGIGPALLLVPRNSCSFGRIALPRNDSKGIAAERLRARSGSRFACPRVLVVPDRAGSGAGVWTWAESVAAQAGRRPAQTLMLPETVVREALQEGIRLVSCLDGFEAEVWNDSTLIASRWWRAPPSAADWQLFLSAVPTGNLPEQAALPAPEEVGWREAPLNANLLRRDMDNCRAVLSPRHTGLAAAAALAAVFGYQFAQLASAELLLLQERARIEDLSVESRTADRERRVAHNVNRRAVRLAAMDNPTTALRTALAVLDTLPAEGTDLREVTIENGRVEAIARSGQPLDLPAITAALEGTIALKNATARRLDASGGFSVAAEMEEQE